MPETYIYNKEDPIRLLKTATIETDKYGYQTLILKKEVRMQQPNP